MAKTSAPKGGIAFLQAGEAGFERAFNKLCARRAAQEESVDKTVAKIVADVRENGDAELFALTKKLDGCDLEKFEVHKKDWDAACDRVPPATARRSARARCACASSTASASRRAGRCAKRAAR